MAGSEWMMEVGVNPRTICAPVHWTLDGQPLYATNYCPQTMIASITSFNPVLLSNGYHTITATFDGDSQYAPCSINGTFNLVA